MKKILLLFLALFLMVTFADAAWITKPAKIVFNDCPDQLSIVRYGLNYITSGDNNGGASVYVTVHAKGSVMFGCAYFKVYGPAGELIYRGKKRLRAFGGSDENVYAQIPPEDMHGLDISADIGVGCDCNKPW
jgi:hypothetical protein